VHPAESHFIDGQWIAAGGTPFSSTNPATDEINWTGNSAAAAQTSAAAAAARRAFPAWANTPIAERIRLVNALAERFRASQQVLAEAISRETGKPRWESLTEVDAMVAKAAISIQAYETRCKTATQSIAGATGAVLYRPHGVLVVFGPFNMPGHLPNGHLVPALLAGNTVIFKPSEQTPLVGRLMIEAVEAAGFPPGVVNLLQGGPDTGAALAAENQIDGILFTGSSAVGAKLNQSLASRPGKILALEMGGNNPLVVHEAADLKAAAWAIVQSAYITSGQRCSCARRLILVDGAASKSLVEHLQSMLAKMRLGFWTDEPEPFMGTVISSHAAEKLLVAQADLVRHCGKSLTPMKRESRSAALLTPGLLDVTNTAQRPDEEIFGPLLQFIRVKDFASALEEANRTSFGLSAGLISDRRENYDKFAAQVRAGVIHWNRPLTGASSQLPFGGIGRSGNHRPGGYFASDYSSYALATLESPSLQLPPKLPPGINL
jgi:succinylglutamic semialdehyde dehydrogenase